MKPGPELMIEARDYGNTLVSTVTWLGRVRFCVESPRWGLDEKSQIAVMRRFWRFLGAA